MNQTKSSFGTSWDIKSKRAKLIGAGIKNPVGRGTVIGALYIFAACQSYGQIEADAYITDPLSNPNSGKIFIVNTATNTSVGSPISVGSLPVGVAVTPDGRYAYITNNGSNTISVIDTASHAVVRTLNVASGPLGVAATPDGRYVYVTSPGPILNNNGFVGNTVSVIDTSTNMLVGSINGGTGPIGVALTPNGRSAYVGNNSDNTVSVINTAGNAVVGTISLGSTNQPTGVAVTADGRYVYVANNASNSVSVINTTTNTIVGAPIPVGNSPVGVAITPDGQYVYVANMNNNNRPNTGSVSVISTATNTVVTTIGVGISPIGIAVTPDGRFVYVANSNINNGGIPSNGILSVISTATNRLLTSLSVGTGPFSFGSFIGPNIIIAQGGPLSIANDASLSALGFGQFVDFNGGTLKTTGDLVTSRTISLLATGGTIDTNGFNAILAGGIINSGSLRKTGAGTLTLIGTATYTGGTIINAGALQLGNGGTTGSILGNVMDNAALIFNRSNTLSFGGVISGTGSVQQNGSGTTVLLSDNTYAGGTIINAGALQLGNGGTTGGILGNVINNGALIFNRSNTLSFGGVISGTGNVQQNGPGTTVLLSDNTYAGGTIINAGALQLGNGGTTGSILGNITDNGALIFNRSNTLTFDGVINGTGSVQQNGTGTTVLLAENTYAGKTIINAGALQLGNGGTTGSILGNVMDNGALIFNRSNTLSFDGVISGTGSVQQNGPGTTVLLSDNTYTGATTVNGGSLIVDGSIANGQTLVNSGGLLGGRGSLGGSLVNNGTVSPGNSPGTLTVNRDYTQNAAGALRIEVAGLAPSEHDVLAVGGHASLAGTLQIIRLGAFKLHVGDQLTFLTANGGVSGTFAAIQNELATGTIVKAQVVNLPNAVVLEGTQGSFVEGACTPNSIAVAEALDSAIRNPRASTLINFLDEEPLNSLCNDFELIAPEELASIFNIGVSLANVQTANLKRRMEDIRAGSNGFSAAGFALNGSASNVSSGFAGVTGPEGKSGTSVMAPTPENRWGVWVTGVGEFTNIDGTENAPGYNFQTGGITFGIDYRLCPNFAIGLTAGYANTGADLVNGGNLEVNGGKLGLYGTVFGAGFYLDTGIIGGLSGYDTQRTALLGRASGWTDGAEFNVLVAGGYDWTKGNLSIGPTANFQYTYVGFDSFTESGSLAPLKFNSQHAESIRTALGMKASYDWKMGHLLIKPEISIAWQHEYGNQAYSIVSGFASGAGSSFTVDGPAIGRDSMLISAGAAVLLSERTSIYAYYDGEFFRTNYQSNNVSAGVRITF